MKDTTIRQEIQQTVIADNRSIEAVVGLDLGDKNSWMTRLELNGTESLSCSIHTSPSALTKYFSKQKRLRVVIEAGSHSNWITQLLERLGHEVIVAHPRPRRVAQGFEDRDGAAADDPWAVERADPAHGSTGAEAGRNALSGDCLDAPDPRRWSDDIAGVRAGARQRSGALAQEPRRGSVRGPASEAARVGIALARAGHLADRRPRLTMSAGAMRALRFRAARPGLGVAAMGL